MIYLLVSSAPRQWARGVPITDTNNGTLIRIPGRPSILKGFSRPCQSAVLTRRGVSGWLRQRASRADGAVDRQKKPVLRYLARIMRERFYANCGFAPKHHESPGLVPFQLYPARPRTWPAHSLPRRACQKARWLLRWKGASIIPGRIETVGGHGLQSHFFRPRFSDFASPGAR